MKNLKIKSKLLVCFSFVIVLTVILSVFAVTSLESVRSAYSYMDNFPKERRAEIKEVNTAFIDIRANVARSAIYIGNASKLDGLKAAIADDLTAIDLHIKNYIDILNADTKVTSEARKNRTDAIAAYQSALEEYKATIMEPVFQAAYANKLPSIVTAFEQAAPIVDTLNQTLKTLITAADSLAASTAENTEASVKTSILILIITAAFVVVASIILAMIIAGMVTKPIVRLVAIAESLSKGDLNVNISNNSKDETGLLSQNIEKVIHTLRSLIDEMNFMAKEHDVTGDIDVRINSKAYTGAYNEVADAVNKMVDGHIQTKKKAVECFNKISSGDFSATIEKLPGKKIFINDGIESLRQNLMLVNREVVDMANATIEGDLNRRVDTTKYSGDWVTLMDGLNGVLTAVSEPITEATAIIAQMSQGNFDSKVTGNYKGGFAEIKNSLNFTVSTINSYIVEINKTLSDVASGDMTKKIGREYVGQFASIKDSINTISSSLNKTLSEITLAAEHVLSGARQISSSAMSLAEGATEQASAVQELTASVELINAQTQVNASSAGSANELSLKSTEYAKNGNVEMKEMLTSMQGIKDASNNISKIIKVIEDIAFQTNLLALNAAVEAARAGAHGKGFAVVAEEVRNLAARSQTAAKETTELIEDSINKVNDGTKIAQVTASSLELIVENASSVSAIITQISNASQEQAEAVSQVSIGLSQISQVIQTNSSTSEESASASEELNSQAEMLKEMVSFFKLA